MQSIMTSSVQIFGWLEHITPPAANEAGDALLAAAPLAPDPGIGALGICDAGLSSGRP